MIAIADCGTGNVGAIQNVFRCNSVESLVTNSVNDIRTVDQLALPGVGGLVKTEQLQDSAWFRDPANALHIFNNAQR